MKFSRRQIMAIAMAMPIGLAACSATYRNHGYVPPDAELAQVVVGQTGRDALDGMIGRPSAQGLLTGSAWYYVGSRWRFYGALAPREIEREVLVISFNEAGTVTNIERFGMERGRVIVLSRRITDSGVTSIGLIRQLMGNVGRVSAGQLLNE